MVDIHKKPSVERVRALLGYDKATGVFRWKEFRSHNAQTGDVAGTKSSKGYWIISIDGHQFYAHHLAWVIEMGEWPTEIDHRNTNSLDNAWENLRLGNDQLNAENKRRALSTNQSSGVLGVSRQLRSSIKPWKAQIRINGKIVYLGSFASIDEASEAYREAKRKHHEGYDE